MIQQVVEEVKFQYVMLNKLQNQARRTNKLMHWLQYLNALEQNTSFQNKDKIIIQMHQRFILNEEFWIKEVNRKLNQQKIDQSSIQFSFLALQDGFYFSVAKLIANKLCSQSKQNRLRLNFIIAKIEALIQHFNHRKKQGGYFYKSLRSIYQQKNNKKKIRQTYVRQIKMHFDDFDVVYDQYDMWEQSNAEINKKQYEQLFKNAKAQWEQDQQHFQITYFFLVVKFMQNYKTQNENPNNLFINKSKRARVHIFRALQQIEDRNTSKLDQQKYLWLLSFLITEKQKHWFLRRVALMRRQLYEQYLQNLELFSQIDQAKIINAHKIIISLNLEYQDIIKFQYFYLKFLVRRFNKHLHEVHQEQYNKTWGEKVQFFRNQISDLIQKQRPKIDLQLECRQMFYNFWLDVEASLVKDKQTISHLFQNVIAQHPTLDLYIKYSNEMLKFSDIKLAKKILKRACQAYQYKTIIVQSVFNFFAIYGEINQILKFKNQVKTFLQKRKNKQIIQNALASNKDQLQNLSNDKKKELKLQQNVILKRNNIILPNKQKQQNSQSQQPEVNYKRSQSQANPSEKLQEKITSLQRKKQHLDGENTLFIKGIINTWTQSDILKILKYKEHVKQVRLIQKNGQKKHYCYVQYQNQQWALKEVKQNETEYEMNISRPPSAFDQAKTIFVCALPKTATKESIMNLLSQELQKKVLDVRIKLNDQKNYAYIDFEDQESKNKALQQSKDRKLIINQKKVVFQQCDSDRIKGKKFVKVIFIKNLPFKCQQQDITDFLHKNAIQNISKIFIPKNENNKSKGFAYVEFQKFKDFQSALDLKKGQILGRKIQILKSDRQITQGINKRKQTQQQYSEPLKKQKKQLEIKQNLQSKKGNNFFSNMFK